MWHAALHFRRVAGNAVIFQRNAWGKDKLVITNLAAMTKIDNFVGCIHRCCPFMDNIYTAVGGKTIIVVADRAVISEATEVQVRVEAGVVALRRLDQGHVNSALRILSNIAGCCGAASTPTNHNNARCCAECQ